MKRSSLLFMMVMLAGCSPAPTPTPKPIYQVHASSSVEPWLSELYTCADNFDALISINSQGAEGLTLRMGEPDALTAPAFQIDKDEILVVAHSQTGVGKLTLDQVQEIFSGRIKNWSEVGGNDFPVEVWVYADGEDLRGIINQDLLNGLKISSSAKVAISTQNMSDAVGSSPGAIGVLPRRWKAGNTQEIFIMGSYPVLAIVDTEPDEILRNVLACLQK